LLEVIEFLVREFLENVRASGSGRRSSAVAALLDAETAQVMLREAHTLSGMLIEIKSGLVGDFRGADLSECVDGVPLADILLELERSVDDEDARDALEVAHDCIAEFFQAILPERDPRAPVNSTTTPPETRSPELCELNELIRLSRAVVNLLEVLAPGAEK